MKPVIIIPSRYQSSRLPGKPLVNVAGHSLLRRVWSICKAVEGAEVYVATDDERIAEHARSFGGQAIMTNPDCQNGTERVYDAVKQLPQIPELIVNVQGDAVRTPPAVIAKLVADMRVRSDWALMTPAIKLKPEEALKLFERKQKGDTGTTLVTFDRDGRALYFSKSFIPFPRNNNDGTAPAYKHIGIYGYRLDSLKQYISLEATPLEQVEGLEQLRALENGLIVRISIVEAPGITFCSIDNPADVERAEEIIRREGEVVKIL